MNLLLAEVGIGQWVLLGALALILIASPFLMRAKNKREMENQQKMMEAIKKGDSVLTSAGVIGKVVSIENKEGYKTVTIETGDSKHKGYLCVDIASIYYNLSNPPAALNQVANVEKSDNLEKVEEENQAPENKEEVVEQNNNESQLDNETKKESKPKNKSQKSKNKK